MKQFLTPERKEMYMKDFKENVLTCKDEYWQLDKGIEEILIAINQHQDRQTLYSRFYTSQSEDAPLSYLLLSITSDYEPILNKIVKELKQNYKKEFRFDVESPKRFLGDTSNPLASHLSCNANEEHFNTSVFSLQFYSNKVKKHKEFWLEIKKLLTK